MNAKIKHQIPFFINLYQLFGVYLTSLKHTMFSCFRDCKISISLSITEYLSFSIIFLLIYLIANSY